MMSFNKNEEAKSIPYERRWIAVVALGLSLFLSALDATIVALALPPIGSHFRLSDSLVSTVTLSYAIPLTLFILPSGARVNRFRSLPLFLASVIGFGAGSVLCALAPSFVILLAGRVVQGSFAAVIGTQGFALVAAVVSDKERGKAMGVIGTIAPLGGVAGPGIGGLLLTSFGWSSIFFVNVPVIVVASVLGIYSLRGVSIWKHGRAGNPLGQMGRLLRIPQFSFGLLAFFFSVAVGVALYYLLPFDLSGVQHFPTAVSGAVFLTVPLGMMVMGMVGGYLTDIYRPRRLILIGSGLALFGAFMVSMAVTTRTSELDIAWRLFLLGAGMGLFSSPNSTAIMSSGGREMMGAAGALVNLSARLGTVFSPLVMGITWSLLATFSAQMTVGMVIVDVLALATFIFAISSAMKMKDVQKHQ
jgi:MFS family permease